MSIRICNRCDGISGTGRACRTCGADIQGAFSTRYGESPEARAAQAAEQLASRASKQTAALSGQVEIANARNGVLEQAVAVAQRGVQQAQAMLFHAKSQIERHEATIASLEEEIARLRERNQKLSDRMIAGERGNEEGEQGDRGQTKFLTDFARFSTDPEDLWIVKTEFGLWSGPISAAGLLAAYYAGALSRHSSIFRLNRDGSLGEPQILVGETLTVLAAAVCRHEPATHEAYPGFALSTSDREKFKYVFARIVSSCFPALDKSQATNVGRSLFSSKKMAASLDAVAPRTSIFEFFEVMAAHERLLQTLRFCASIRFQNFESRFGYPVDALRRAAEAGACLQFFEKVLRDRTPENAVEFPHGFVRGRVGYMFEVYSGLHVPSAIKPEAIYAAKVVLDFLSREGVDWAHAISTIAVGGGREPFSGRAAIERDDATFINMDWVSRHEIYRYEELNARFDAWVGDHALDNQRFIGEQLESLADEAVGRLATDAVSGTT